MFLQWFNKLIGNWMEEALAKRMRRRWALPLRLEELEVRWLPSNGQWLARLDGLPGLTRAEQIQSAGDLLHAAGLQDQDIRAIDHVGVDGIVVLQSPVTTP